MTNQVIKIDTPELKMIEKSKAEQIKKVFEPMTQMLLDFESSYNSIIKESEKEITEELVSKAKRLRIDVGKVRIETGKLKDKQKEYIKLEDKAIMGVHNILVWAVKEKEDVLREIEDHFKIQEEKRLADLQLERAEMLSKFIDDAFDRDLSHMEEDVWMAYYQAKKKEYDDRIAAEIQAETERIEQERIEKLRSQRREQMYPYFQHWNDSEKALDFGEISEEEFLIILNRNIKAKDDFEKAQEKQRIENERLKKEAKERKAREEAERKKREETERNAREAHEAELNRAREENERIEREAKKERERLQSELKAREEAERKAKQEEEERIQAELSKGDSAKVQDLISDLESLKTKYTFRSVKNKKMYADVGALIDKIVGHIK